MLKLLQTFARQLAWLSRPLLLLIMLLPVVIVAGLLASGPGSQDTWLIPAILFFLWVLLFYTCVNLFAEVPAPAGPEQSLWRRISISLRRGLYYILALLAVGIAIATLVTTYQLTSVWVYMYVL